MTDSVFDKRAFVALTPAELAQRGVRFTDSPYAVAVDPAAPDRDYAVYVDGELRIFLPANATPMQLHLAIDFLQRLLPLGV